MALSLHMLKAGFLMMMLIFKLGTVLQINLSIMLSLGSMETDCVLSETVITRLFTMYIYIVNKFSYNIYIYYNMQPSLATAILDELSPIFVCINFYIFGHVEYKRPPHNLKPE